MLWKSRSIHMRPNRSSARSHKRQFAAFNIKLVPLYKVMLPKNILPSDVKTKTKQNKIIHISNIATNQKNNFTSFPQQLQTSAKMQTECQTVKNVSPCTAGRTTSLERFVTEDCRSQATSKPTWGSVGRDLSSLLLNDSNGIRISDCSGQRKWSRSSTTDRAGRTRRFPNSSSYSGATRQIGKYTAPGRFRHANMQFKGGNHRSPGLISKSPGSSSSKTLSNKTPTDFKMKELVDKHVDCKLMRSLCTLEKPSGLLEDEAMHPFYLSVERIYWDCMDRKENWGLLDTSSAMTTFFKEMFYQTFPELSHVSMKTVLSKYETFRSSLPICGAVLLNKNMDKLLLVKNKKCGHQMGYWGFPKGKVEIPETHMYTAMREVLEETGIDISDRISETTPFLEQEIKRRNTKLQIFIIMDVDESEYNEDRHNNNVEIEKVEWIHVDTVKKYVNCTTRQAMAARHRDGPQVKYLFSREVFKPFFEELCGWIEERKGQKSDPIVTEDE